MNKETLAIYYIISEIMKTNGDVLKDTLIYNAKDKIGVKLSNEDIESYIKEDLFEYSGINSIKLGPASKNMFKPETIGTVWVELPPYIRDAFVYSATEYPPALKNDDLWKLATSPTGKLWVDGLFVNNHDSFDIIAEKIRIRENGTIIKNRLKKSVESKIRKKFYLQRYTPDLHYYDYYSYRILKKKAKYIKDKMYDLDVIEHFDGLNEKQKSEILFDYQDPYESLIAWSSNLIPLFSEKLKKYNITEVSRKDLTIPDEDVTKLEEMLKDWFNNAKKNKIEDLKSQKALLEREGQQTESGKDTIDNINKMIDYWNNRNSIIRDESRCPIGLDSETCKYEWKLNDSIDKYAYADRFGSRISLSLLYPGLYISPQKKEISIPCGEFLSIQDIVDELHPSQEKFNPKNVNLISQWEIKDDKINFTLEENDDSHPPYLKEYFLSKEEMKNIFKELDRIYAS